MIKWNPKVKLILADVDETIADVYMPARPEMIKQLERILERGIKLFMISGGGLKSICNRVAFLIRADLRKNILISHCSGSEVWGFEENGDLRTNPYYSVYDASLNDLQKTKWREIVNRLVNEFKLKTYGTMSVPEFKKITDNDPLSVMLDDRGPQITLEVVNGYNLDSAQVKKLEILVPLTHGSYDLRVPIAERADQLFIENNLPITSRLEGVFAINFAIKGVSKETSVKYVFENKAVLESIGLNDFDINNPDNFEIWGDKFSEIKGASDKHMSVAMDPRVRSIDFREENPEEYDKKYNINLWDGKKHLHEGLLEYLQLSFS